MGPEEDLNTLLSHNDHLNILRYIRAHKLREPHLVLSHGKPLLGFHSDGSTTKPSQSLDDATRLAALEQLCIAALDVGNTPLAESCLHALHVATSHSSVTKESSRYRKLLGMFLEASAKFDDAAKVYDELLVDNPSNGYAAKRKYCILAAQAGKEEEAIKALNDYLSMHPGDIAAWNQMAEACLSVSDFKGAAYCYEEVVLGCPLDSNVHMKLGEVYATAGGIENAKLARKHLAQANAKLARKHLAQAVQLDANNLRAWFGLINASENYLVEVEQASKGKKEMEEEGVEVAKELILFGGAKLMEFYQGTVIGKLVERLLKDSAESM
ncbi:hypothetical protein ACHAW6_000476 [Cyclotella cf. meneghiniana]